MKRAAVSFPHAPGSESVARALAPALSDAGKTLALCGSILGTDRITGKSPKDGCGDARVVALSALAQIATDLCAATVLLLDARHYYAAAGQIRHLVEVEYLSWSFADDFERARDWIASSSDDRKKRWSPRVLRKQSKGHFRDADYAHHCDFGGHPTPLAAALLRGHLGLDFLMFELATHGACVWENLVRGSKEGGPWLNLEKEDSSAERLDAAIRTWREDLRKTA